VQSHWGSAKLRNSKDLWSSQLYVIVNVVGNFNDVGKRSVCAAANADMEAFHDTRMK